jgi:hypothetical protein
MLRQISYYLLGFLEFSRSVLRKLIHLLNLEVKVVLRNIINTTEENGSYSYVRCRLGGWSRSKPGGN